MNNSRFERLAPLTGVLTTVLILAGAVGGSSFDYLPSADRAAEIYSESPIRVMADGYLGLVAAFTLIWFAGSVYVDLRKREGGTGRLSMLAFGGGIASGLTVGVAYAVKVTAGARAGATDGISPIAAVTLYDLYSAVIGNLAAFTFAAFIGAAALVWLRTGMTPRWTGWASIVLALGLVSPIGYLFVAFALVWLVVVSVWLYRRGAAPSVPADPALGTT
jgi:hypothetical protein